MNTLVISPHSFVDLITNSSSELFICDTKKSIDTVKEIVIEVVKITNQKMKLKEEKEYDISSVFTEMFQEPEIYQFNFPWCSEYVEYTNLKGYNLEETSEVYAECLEKQHKWNKINPAPKYPSYTSDKYPSEEELAPYYVQSKIHQAKSNEAMALIYKPFFELYKEAHDKCLQHYCKLNDIDFLEIEFKDCLPSAYPSITFKKGKHDKFLEEFQDAMSWDYTAKKGDIILRSKSDNTVPYELFEDLEDILKAQRIHLG